MNVKVSNERSTCVVPTIIYQTIQGHEDSLKTILLLYWNEGGEASLPTLVCLLNLLLRRNFFGYVFPYDAKQILDEVFVISGVINNS